MTGLQWVQIAMGPGGAIAVLLLVGWSFIKFGLPFIEARFAEHRADLTRIMDSHEKDRTVWADGISRLTAGLDALTGKVGVLADDVEDLKKAQK